MDGMMMDPQKSVALGAGALALVGTLAAGALPLSASLAVATAVCAGLGCVAAMAQRRRFEDESRLVYRLIHVRSRIVQGRFRSFED